MRRYMAAGHDGEKRAKFGDSWAGGTRLGGSAGSYERAMRKTNKNQAVEPALIEIM